VRCPDDVELVSADDSTWLDVFQPPITTVATPSYEIGQEGARLLLKRFKRASAKRQRIILQPKLIARTHLERACLVKPRQSLCMLIKSGGL
jgi:DNA-binding LacI/PurR family transcriptional regulator